MAGRFCFRLARTHIPAVGLAAWNKQTIKAYEILGSALDPAAQVTNTVLTVKELLTPLSREELKVVRCLGLNYSDHAAETKMAKPAAPILFYKPLSSMIGPNAPISVPMVAQPVEVHLSDYEVELTIVIGKTAKNVSEAEALDYVLGYTAANDVSFRKHQMMTSQWGFSKGFDNTTPIGPCIVSNNAIPDPQLLPLTCTLNGKTLRTVTPNHSPSFPKPPLSNPARSSSPGPPPALGLRGSPAIVLKHGDDCRVWIGHGIGTLVNPVAEEGKRTAKL
ncbi:hypothetical protein JVT61DRAFT_13289 [Boletus reticuloceps]|uniref:Fumarylacetoacetase-like C-terminal domain-containing protein n=1 Tax=Boletus reticuloceps TaxID=495285 RepID=A0A8I3AB99_9AGAM|nr:hypothetical protein JVT61DRAFT_13289 [Boletus reticuloceps]